MDEARTQRTIDARPPLVLEHPDYPSSLAAARCVGAKGVEVRVAGTRLFDPVRWSRFARPLAAPTAPEALVAWLRDEAPPGLVVCPSSDDFAWALSCEREALARKHQLYSPPISAMEAVLDKRRLHELAAGAGLATPACWYPADEAEALRMAPSLPFPVLLKPRTQVLSLTHSKGYRVASAADLPAAWRAATSALRFQPSLLERIPGAAVPMIQAYHAAVSDGIITISGFVDQTHQHFVARGSIKLLQSPRGLGVGSGFQAIPLDPKLAAGVAALCKQAGYYGVFDVEFLDAGEPLLIDFNPRFYNQISLEISRGLPSPWLAYLGAVGDQAELARAAAAAADSSERQDAIFCNRLVTGIDMVGQVLTGRQSVAEALRWRRWYLEHRRFAVDPFDAPGDRGPLLAQWVSELSHILLHPRAFLRQRILLRG